VQLTDRASTDGPPRPPVTARIVDVQPILGSDKTSGLAATLTLDVGADGDRPERRIVTVHPGRQPLVELDSGDDSRTIELESFDLFAHATIHSSKGAVSTAQGDVAEAITRMAGLDRLGRTLRPVPATIEVDDDVTVDFAARYAPYRDGGVHGEERSLLSETLTRAVDEPQSFDCEIQLTATTGEVYRVARSEYPGEDPIGAARYRTESDRSHHRLTVGGFGEQPVALNVEATIADAFGLTAHATAQVANYRIVDAGAWVERASGISRAAVENSRADAERAMADAPDPATQAAIGMLTALTDVLAQLDQATAAPARRVAGVIQLSTRIAELLPRVRLCPDSSGIIDGFIATTAHSPAGSVAFRDRVGS
jgi:hypothetical protein